jgi:hypothetical protein
MPKGSPHLQKKHLLKTVADGDFGAFDDEGAIWQGV